MSLALHAGPDGGALSVIPLVALVAALLAYALATRHQWAAGRAWSPWRLASFCAGVALLAVAFSPALDARAGEDFRAHVVQHLLVGMFAPIALILAAPVTLVLRTVPRGRRRRLAPLLRSGALHVLTHPVTVVIVDMGALYVLYLTPLYAATLMSTPLHALVHAHVLLAGCIFAWAIIGTDPAPRRPAMAMRVGALVIAAALHAVLAKLLYAHGWPAGTAHDEAELQAGARSCTTAATSPSC